MIGGICEDDLDVIDYVDFIDFVDVEGVFVVSVFFYKGYGCWCGFVGFVEIRFNVIFWRL